MDIVLDDIAMDAYRTGRNPVIITQIDHRNAASARLFSSRGFHDDGVDPDDMGFHIWSREVEPRESRLAKTQFLIDATALPD